MSLRRRDDPRAQSLRQRRMSNKRMTIDEETGKNLDDLGKFLKIFWLQLNLIQSPAIHSPKFHKRPFNLNCPKNLTSVVHSFIVP